MFEKLLGYFGYVSLSRYQALEIAYDEAIKTKDWVEFKLDSEVGDNIYLNDTIAELSEQNKDLKKQVSTLKGQLTKLKNKMEG